MSLNVRAASLVAVGASVAANCQPCLEINVRRAMACGVTAQDISDAVEVGRKVRAGAASKLDRFAGTLEIPPTASTAILNANCDCGQ